MLNCLSIIVQSLQTFTGTLILTRLDQEQLSFLTGFSRTIVGVLKDQDVKYSSFDILSDEEVRQGMFCFF